MCGRYSIYDKKEELERRFGATVSPSGIYVPHFNAAPSYALPVILNRNPEEIIKASWGFLPHWAGDSSTSFDKTQDKSPRARRIRPQINARAETISQKPFFREAFKNKRCLVLADSFFEWDKKRPGKIPYRITVKGKEPFDKAQGKPFAFAGIWDEAERGGKKMVTFAIITTSANALVAKIHNRMPVILKKEDEEDWLDRGLRLEDAQEMLRPYPEELMEMYEVGREVNSPKNDLPDILEPV